MLIMKNTVLSIPLLATFIQEYRMLDKRERKMFKTIESIFPRSVNRCS